VIYKNTSLCHLLNLGNEKDENSPAIGGAVFDTRHHDQSEGSQSIMMASP